MYDFTLVNLSNFFMASFMDKNMLSHQFINYFD
jgi:hypothetical protein